ncbi:hypothetical protein Cni_G10561 [Canna indica]|uniref:DUF3741 domain-containing protein n=1 Tax=Canna indica TaxID=4628 RepID=A0AAQ3Q8P3_9LILI|nr:hypothetical protein Cni_G10561 [Canna indica]
MGNGERMRTSSSRREVRTESRRSTIGCMSGIFHFLSRHHSRSQKRLTSGKKKEKPTTIKTTPVPPPSTPPPPPPPVEEDAKKTEPRRSSCEKPRSPTIPQQIRQPAASPAAASSDSPRRSTALVARLMGLDDAPPAPALAGTSPGDKRRELLQALQKCDEDLKSLRRIIEAVRSSDTAPAAERIELDGEDSIKDCNGEQPSPVSVLDAISSPRYRSKRSPNEKQGIAAVGSRIVKPSRMGVLFTGEQNKITDFVRVLSYKKALDAAESYSLLYRRNMTVSTAPAPRREFRSKGRVIMENFLSAAAATTEAGAGRRCWRRWRMSRAMAENVKEVWEDGVWEERWEVGRVGVWLEEDILWDMVEELVAELFGCYRKLSLPVGTCRKQLRF